MTGARLVAIVLLSLSLCVTCLAADAAPPQKPADIEAPLWNTLVELDAKVAKIRDFSADFEQQKFTALLRHPMVSRGRVLVKGPRMRWDTASPRRTVMTLDPHEVKIYYPDEKLVEIYRLGDRLADLAASPLPRLAVVVKHFRIAALHDDHAGADDVSIRLTPRDEELAKHVDHVDVRIDRRTGCTAAMSLTDADGEKTVITFAHVEIDRGIEDAALELHLPPGTKVSRPLEAVEGR